MEEKECLKKSGMCVGDSLILTKPLGTGVIFAADMRHRACASWTLAAIGMALTSNLKAALTLRECGASSCTDVTGFGLIGHLMEMIQASTKSRCRVKLDVGAIPLLSGALECSRLGIHSSLLGSNMAVACAVQKPVSMDLHLFELLFDPQTSGGLLATVPSSSANQCFD